MSTNNVMFFLYLLLCFLTTLMGTFGYDLSDQYLSRWQPRNHLLKIQQIDNQIDFGNDNALTKNARHDKQISENKNHAEIDVANFILKPDYNEIDENALYNYGYNNRLKSKLYEDYGLVNDINLDNNRRGYNNKLVINEDHVPEYNEVSNLNNNNINYINRPAINDEQNNGLYQDSENEIFEKLYNKELLLKRDTPHSPERKSSFKNLRFPFFFRNKTHKHHSKKEKKNTILELGSHKNNAQTNDLSNINNILNFNNDAESSHNLKSDNMLRPVNEKKIRRKRSCLTFLCPDCKRKYIVNDRRKRNLITNFEPYQHDTLRTTKKTRAKICKRENDMNVSETDNNKRANIDDKRNLKVPNHTIEKRDSAENTDKERQLKELEHIEREINNIEIFLQKFRSPSPSENVG